jgi:orotidine-5'-phosphate decarboxylase
MENGSQEFKADDRLIVALDVNSFDKMTSIVEKLGPLVSYYKVGMELYYSAGRKTIRYLRSKGKKIFLDLKLHDIPNTVGHSVASVTKLGVNMITVHAGGGRAMMEAAARNAKITAEELGVEPPKILAVTVLTSFDDQGWKEIGGQLPIQDHVLKLAKLAASSGVDGVVASPREAAMIRKETNPDFLIVTPGIRPSFAQTDDQRRIATPSKALNNGSSMLVIGRPITQAIDPCAACRLILKEIKENVK